MLKDCIWAVVEVMEDGSIKCPLVDVMGCEECYKILERQQEREEGKN